MLLVKDVHEKLVQERRRRKQIWFLAPKVELVKQVRLSPTVQRLGIAATWR